MRTTFLRRGRLCLILATTIALASCAGKSRDGASATPGGQATQYTQPAKATAAIDRVTWALRSEPTTLDSGRAVGGDSWSVLANVCESLVYQQPDGRTVPALAESVSRPDDRTYVFTLRHGVRFFDGKLVTAEDVVFSLNRSRNPETGSFFAGYTDRVSSIEKTGADQITIKLSKPDAIFYQMLSTPLGHILQKSYTQSRGTAYGTATGGVMCTGAYRVEDWRKGDSITLEPNPDWWNRANRPQLTQQAKFVFLSDGSTLTSALLNGDVDGTFFPAATAIPRLKQSTDGTVYFGPSSLLHSLVVAHSGGILADPKLRQAVAEIIDYKGIVRTAFQSAAEPLRAIAPPGSWGTQQAVYRPAYDALRQPEQDLDGARRLILESGVTNPALTLAVPGWLPEYRTFGETFQSDARKAGLTVKLQLLQKADFLALFGDKSARAKVDLFYTDYFASIPDPTELYTQLGTGGGSINYSGYRNAEVTQLLEQARATADDAQRAELTVKAQGLIMKDRPWIPFASPYQLLYLNKRLGGAVNRSPAFMYWPWLPDVGKR
ncbi:ABC transporter substrate-binding protein [Kribbella turkmenica]|uniref:ABC transporter substrate-binding protein n=1 Tax=Kribbella turkmenica TaxID=2530375 RepID=A0A4R4XJ00_9ACTN|nr:ABC transporter substrate-binding protein [Kribbella turkmenica]TDD30492.1 ABC transporter substrate-binding protein [Kribbella turkmenica]